MKKFLMPLLLFVYILVFLILFSFKFKPAESSSYAGEFNGYILLQVEKNGEAFYVCPVNSKRYYLGRPADAFAVMKKFSLGVKHDYLQNIAIFPNRLSGMILLDVEANGEAYYIYPKDLKKYYLGRPADAFRIMRELGRGISNAGLANIAEAQLEEPAADITLKKMIIISNVPFTPQAPLGDWTDQRLQDGCEEASALMAVKWARNEKLTKQEANNEIIKISDYELKKYKEYRDISSADTVKWIFNDYFKFDNVSLAKNITIDDIISELVDGNLIITAMNGQALHNPNFKQPGPITHMLVIRGYDPASKEFIVNDPGTRNGELYRYDEIALYQAIRDYPTGYHESIPKIEKNMIVVGK